MAGRPAGHLLAMPGRAPEEIWEESLDEGERRLSRRWPGLAATAFAGGADVFFGIVALMVTTAALLTVMPEPLAHVLGATTFGIAFALITLGRAELFTENLLIPVGAVRGTSPWRSGATSWAGRARVHDAPGTGAQRAGDPLGHAARLTAARPPGESAGAGFD